MGINEKSLIECPGELKCSETVVTMSGKCFISNFVCSFSDYILLSLSDIMYVTFLASNEVNYIRRNTYKIILETETSRRGCAKRIELDSTVLEHCEQRGLLHFETEPEFTDLFS